MTCRICFGDELPLRRVCKCADPVHLPCLNQWRKQMEACEICRERYYDLLPNLSELTLWQWRRAIFCIDISLCCIVLTCAHCTLAYHEKSISAHISMATITAMLMLGKYALFTLSAL